MNKIIINIIIIIFPILSFSQWNEDFSDNELLNNPLWRGEATKFIVDNGILRLNDTIFSGRANIHTSFSPLDDWEMKLTFRLTFNPSSNNFLALRYYSFRDTTSFLELVVGGNADDARLYMVESGNRELLIDGEDDMFDQPLTYGTLNMGIVDGVRTLSFINLETQSSHVLGSYLDSTAFPIGKFEISCIYTSTRSDRFYFDDIEFSGTPWSDRTPPALMNLSFPSRKSVYLEFDEPVFIYSQPGEFQLNPMGISPVILSQPNPYTFGLEFGSPLPEGQYLALDIPPVYDSTGNFWMGKTDSFIILSDKPVEFQDILISEIMSDPSPVIGPYDYEYLELYNHASRAINLEGWNLADGTRTVILPEYILFPGEYVALQSAESCSTTLVDYPRICLDTWVSLNNSGELLILKSKDEILIDSIHYEVKWHDPVKESGGWSLEKGNFEYRCLGGEVWGSSMAFEGGTPGKANQFWVEAADSLWISNSQYLEPDQLEFEFTLPIQPGSHSFDIFRGSSPLGWKDLKIEGNKMQIQLSEPFSKNEPSLVNLKNIKSCWSDQYYSFSDTVVRTDSLKPGDLVINEILFDPFPGGVDFIEVYNSSSKYLDLSQLYIEYLEGNRLGEGERFTNQKVLIAPGEYKALTVYPEFIQKFYPYSRNEHIIKGQVPYLQVESGSIVLRSAVWQTIDSIFYHRDWHLQLLNDTKGVSLELINPAADPLLSANWHSAASTAGYATPGGPNSHLQTMEFSRNLKCSPRVLTMKDGLIEEPLQISYQLSESTWIGSVEIYNIAGFKVAEVVNNQTLSSGVNLFWNGNVSNGRILQEGLYTVRLRAFNNEGKVVEKMGVFGVYER